MDAVWISANVSYKYGPSPDDVKEIFCSGILPSKFKVHINHVLTEMPRTLVESAARETTGDPALALAIIRKLEESIATN